MKRVRLSVFVPIVFVAVACSGSKTYDGGPLPYDGGLDLPDVALDATNRAAAITIDPTTVVTTFSPKRTFGINAAWYIPTQEVRETQAKVQAAGNYFIRFPGGGSADDYHWNGAGSYDDNHCWVPSPVTYVPGFWGSARYRGTTSSYGSPSLVTDGNPSTRWLSNTDTEFPEAQWLYVDLAGSKSVDSVSITWAVPFATTFRVQTANDLASTSTWSDTSAGLLTGVGGTQTVAFSPVTARYLRLLMSASSDGPGGAYSVAELAAFSGSTQVTVNRPVLNQSATTVSSTSPAADSTPLALFDDEGFIVSTITDGKATTIWRSGDGPGGPPTAWFYLDFHSPTPVDSVRIDWGKPFAASFSVQTWDSSPVSGSGAWRDTSAASVAGTEGTQVVTFAPVLTRFLRVLMTDSSAGSGQGYAVAEATAFSGPTQVTANSANSSQTPVAASSADKSSLVRPVANFDFESFMAYVRSFAPAAEPIVTVNLGSGTPKEAAAWVHYANVVKGYGIRYWEVGNEIEGDWETGGPLNARDYVRRYIAFYEAMKTEDPTITVLGPDVSDLRASSNLGDGKTFIEDFIAILNAAGKSTYVNGIDFHWYPASGNLDYESAFALIGQLADNSTRLRSWLSGSNVKSDVPVFLTEFNLGLGGAYVNQMLGGLWVANALGEWIRQFGKGGGTNLWTMLNPLNSVDATNPKLGDTGYLRSGPDYQYQEHATYWAMQMMSTLWAIAGDEREHQLLAASTGQAPLAAYATLRPDATVALAVINKDTSNAYDTSINLTSLVPGPEADVWTFDAHNYLWQDAVAPAHADPDSAPAHTVVATAEPTIITVPPASLTVVRFHPAGQMDSAVP